MSLDLSRAPAWFQVAVAAPAASKFIDVAGTTLHYLAWNEQDTSKPALLFVHGYRAHARWWAHIAPYFQKTHRTYALDLAGMGDSGTRTDYSPETYSRDIVEFIAAQFGTAVVVAHSLGGTRALRAAADHAALIPHLIVLDSFFHFPELSAPLEPARVGSGRVLPDYHSLRARYRLMPEQPVAFPELLDFIAYHSMQRVPDGWRWKFDPQLSTASHERDAPAMLARTRQRVDFVCGERSVIVSAEQALLTTRSLQNARGPIVLPEAHHHLMLDQPLALIATLRSLLA